jgi:hypothetical protein
MGRYLRPLTLFNFKEREKQMNPPYDRTGNLLKVGDRVRGVTKNSDKEVEGVVDEIRLFNPLNVRVQVGEIQKDKDGNFVSGWHYADTAYLELVEAA